MKISFKKITPTRWGVILAALVLWQGGLAPAEADFIFETPSGATVGSPPLPVDARATFSISAGHLTIDLVNLENNPTSVVQSLNGIQFVLSSGQTTGTNFSGSAIHRTIAGNGSYTDTGPSAFTWAVNNDVSNGIEITTLGGPIGPAGTLIGGPNGNDVYSNANGSIAGNTQHNPFLAGTAMITLDVSGLTANAQITSMRFEFNTTAGTNVTGHLVPVPEPSSLALVGMGVAGIASLAYRRRGRVRASSA